MRNGLNSKTICNYEIICKYEVICNGFISGYKSLGKSRNDPDMQTEGTGCNPGQLQLLIHKFSLAIKESGI